MDGREESGGGGTRRRRRRTEGGGLEGGVEMELIFKYDFNQHFYTTSLAPGLWLPSTFFTKLDCVHRSTRTMIMLKLRQPLSASFK